MADFDPAITGVIGGNTTRLMPTKSDRDKAQEFRQRLEVALGPVLEIWDEASQEQFIVGFQFERDMYGRAGINVILTRQF